MARRKRRKYSKKSSDTLLMFFIGAIFLLYILLQAIAEILDQITVYISKLNVTQLIFGVVLIAVSLYGHMRYRAFKRMRRDEAKRREEEYRVKELKRELIRLGNLTYLKQMDPYTFEKFVANLFSIIGYKCEVTKRTGDGGKDIILRKEDELSLVECKRYNGTKVGRPDIQKFHSAIIEMNAKQGFFVTTGEFTNQALECAKEKPIQVINGSILLDWIEEHASDAKEESI